MLKGIKMTMALKADVIMAQHANGVSKPLDLVYLSRMTMGDRNIELEILGLFATQADQYKNSFTICQTPDEVLRAAHTLKGVASSIGAMRLKELLERIEETGSLDVKSIHQEVDAIVNYISQLSR